MAGELITLRADRMKLRQFLAVVAAQSRVSVVAQAGLDDQEVSLHVYQQPVEDVLALVARRLGVDLNSRGGLFYLGKLRPEDRGVLVRRVRRMTADDLFAAVRGLLSRDGAGVAFNDGVVVVSDRVEVLARVETMLEQVEGYSAAVWVVQMALVSLSEEARNEFDADLVPSAELAVSVAAASLGAPRFSGALDGTLASVLEYAKQDERRAVVAEPLLLVRDGETARLHSGQRVPIARRAVDQFGNSTVSEYTFEETGLTVEVELREVSDVDAGVPASQMK